MLTLVQSFFALLRALLRAPIVPVRELIGTPAAYWPAIDLLGLIGLAWYYQIDPRWDSKRDRIIEVLGFVVGVAAIVWFFRLGQFPWSQEQDWLRNWRYLTSLQEAILRGEIPYYLRTQLFGSDRFWANPETLVAPHALLLRAMSVNSFFMLHVLLTFTAGYCGLVGLKLELGLSPLPWVVFLTLFLFNGHITAHLSVGHTQWVSYFLLPWVFLCLTRAARGNLSIQNAAVLALTLAAMIMIGGWHVFVWSLLFTIFFCVVSRARLIFLTETLLLTGLLAAFRLLPAFVTYGGGSNTFALSFRTVPMLIDALATGQTARFTQETEGWWEFDTYVGSIGFVILCLGALPGRLLTGRSKDLRYDRTRFLNSFYLPVLALFVLSLGDVYQSTLFRLPGFVSERVVTRIAIVPALALLLIGCVRVDRWLTSNARRLNVLSIGSLLASYFLVAQVVLSAARWRPPTTVAPPAGDSLLVVRATVEGLYVWSVWVGSAVSIAALATVLILVFTRGGRASPPGATA